MIAKNKPTFRKLFAEIASIKVDIFLIFVGNKAHIRPSIKRTKPIAIMNSLKP